MVNAVTGERLVNLFTEGNQQGVVSAALTGGGYVTIWETDGENPLYKGMVGWVHNAFGEPQGLPFRIESGWGADFLQPSVAGTADGGFVVAFSDSETDYVLTPMARRRGIRRVSRLSRWLPVTPRR